MSQLVYIHVGISVDENVSKLFRTSFSKQYKENSLIKAGTRRRRKNEMEENDEKKKKKKTR